MVQFKELDENLRKMALEIAPGTSRREFLQNLALASGGAITMGGWLVEIPEAQAQAPGGQQAPRYGLVLVDFDKCTGCRTCESICANANQKVEVNGEMLPDLGNPAKANIRVAVYYPAVDIPNRCVSCSDAPCVASCPVPEDPQTKRKALYRDEKTLAVKVDADRCIACGMCANACKEQRTGAILLNPDTNRPEGICTLCEGDPQCVKYCPFGALSFSQGGVDTRHYAFNPDFLAKLLTEHYYYPED